MAEGTIKNHQEVQLRTLQKIKELITTQADLTNMLIAILENRSKSGD